MKLFFSFPIRYFVWIFYLFSSSYIHAKTFVVPLNNRLISHQALNGPRVSSYPYISGDTFRQICDFIIDEKQIPFNPAHVNPGDTIFLNNDFLSFFATTVHPHIPVPYILVTHNSDHPAPGKWLSLLNDPKIIAWFGENGDCVNHPKFFHLPIGLANNYWPHGETKIVQAARAHVHNAERTKTLYVNFLTGTHHTRTDVFALFAKKPYAYVAQRKPYRDYLLDFVSSQFVLCPRGNGLDCHRTWEALLMGAIPVMQHSTLDPLFTGLPVLLVDTWQEVTQALLEEKYREIKTRHSDQERMYAHYWLNRIEQVKRTFKNTL